MSTTVAIQRTPDWISDISDYVASISWARDGQSLAVSASSGPIGHRAAADGAPLGVWPGHQGGTFRALFNPAGEPLLSVGQDGQVRFWETGHYAIRSEVKVPAAWVEQAVWSPDGTMAAISAGRQVVALRPDGSILHRFPPLPSTVSGLVWRADGRELAASAYGRIQIWDIVTGQPKEPLLWKTSLISLSWSPDQRWIVAGTQEQSVQIWEMPFRPGNELAMSGYPGKVRSLAWHYSSRFLATDGGPELMVWDCGGRGPAGSTPRILEGHSSRVSVLTYQKAGHLLASGDEDGRLLFWNAGKSTSPLCQARMPAGITCLDWSPDGSALAVGCRSGAVGVVKPGI
ncbi:MAG: PD40 domain-containing protein [Verrucomicrobiales bacterium]|nr:PD40 domain-containing protein [Verrucomicrobiales bacterium]